MDPQGHPVTLMQFPAHVMKIAHAWFDKMRVCLKCTARRAQLILVESNIYILDGVNPLSSVRFHKID